MDETEDNIRPPDKVVREQLMQDNRTDFEKEIDEALYLSMEEYKEQQEHYNKYEEQIIKEHLNITVKRKEIFEVLLLDINRLTKYDKEIKEIFNIIEPIIELYCNSYIENISLDKVTYDKIFNVLSKTRVNKQGLEHLKTIIFSE